jgi:hypothetical protein
MNAVQWVGAKRQNVKWLGAVVLGLGAMDVASTSFAKALLASWNATDGQNWINQYGLQPGDVDPNNWFDRDGYVLAGFVKWWNNSSNSPKLPEVTTKGGVAWVDLTQQHLTALQQWGVSKGVINPGQIPANPAPPPMQSPGNVTQYTLCLQQCAQTHTLDPIAAATCAAACTQQYAPGQPVPPILPPPQLPVEPTQPLPPPPTPIPPLASSTKTAEKPIWPWLIGGAALLGIGALVVAGGR